MLNEIWDQSNCSHIYLWSFQSGKPINPLYFLSQTQLNFLLFATEIFLADTEPVIHSLKPVCYVLISSHDAYELRFYENWFFPLWKVSTLGPLCILQSHNFFKVFSIF